MVATQESGPLSKDGVPPRRRSILWRAIPLALAVLAAGILTLAYCPSLADHLETLLIVQPAKQIIHPDRSSDRVYDAPPVRQPPTVPADRAALDDDTPIIGVLAAGRARAYLVEAFEHGPTSHVVDDLLGGVPVSVTHFDGSNCTRAFTGATPGRPLDLRQGGTRNASMVLKYQGHLYRQDDSKPLDEGGPPFPCASYPAELTVWGVWREAHPASDVYMGGVTEALPPEARRGGGVPPAK